ncbi:MAG TPA: DUF4388 domain-containing protein [Candidatus Polarisedimenticolia bacterium]
MEPSGRKREGVLSSTTFPSLVYSILSQRETGVLTLNEESAEKSIYIQAGHPVFAVSNDRDDRLGQIFFKEGQVPLENLLSALEKSFKVKKRVGTVLVEMGLIQPHDLVEGVLSQVRRIICGLFLWTRGRYRYVPGPLPTEEVITLKLSAGNLILDGVRRIESWERIWEAVGGLDAEYQTVEGIAGLAKDLQLSLDEWTLLSHCEQPINLREICRVSTMKDFDICRLLWAFLTLGVVRRLSALS